MAGMAIAYVYDFPSIESPSQEYWPCIKSMRCIITNPPSDCVITSTLEIADNVPNDSREYLCTAINPAGNVTASASLTVHGK